VALDRLDPLLSTPKKLAALGMLINVKEVEFTFMRDHLGLSDSDLSKQMGALSDASYVKVRKSGRGRDRKTWFASTQAGDKALRSHLAALNDLVLDSIPPPQ